MKSKQTTLPFLEMKVSEFNEDDYSKYDKAAKERLCSFLQARGHKIVDKEENYSIDITSELNGKTHYFEVEFKVKYPFTCQNDFKFESVSFLGRKSKYPFSFYYVILCFETSGAVYCKSEHIFKDEYCEKTEANRNSTKGLDIFYRVPKEKCKFFQVPL